MTPPVTPDFVPAWILILALGLFLYVLLDGFDLGVGILYGFAPEPQARSLIMNSIAPNGRPKTWACTVMSRQAAGRPSRGQLPTMRSRMRVKASGSAP